MPFGCVLVSSSTTHLTFYFSTQDSSRCHSACRRYVQYLFLLILMVQSWQCVTQYVSMICERLPSASFYPLPSLAPGPHEHHCCPERCGCRLEHPRQQRKLCTRLRLATSTPSRAEGRSSQGNKWGWAIGTAKGKARGTSFRGER